MLPSLLVLVGHHEPNSYLWPPYSRCLFIGLLLFCPFPPVRLLTATLEPNNHLPKPKSLGPSVRSVRPFWFEITVPSSHNSLLPLDWTPLWYLFHLVRKSAAHRKPFVVTQYQIQDTFAGCAYENICRDILNDTVKTEDLKEKLAQG